MDKLLKIISLAQKLKEELRHSWLSSNRQESVAEHCFGLALMVLIVEPKLKKKIDLTRALKMAIVHDLGETKAGDIPAFEVSKAREKAKFETERQQVEFIAQECQQSELYELWLEFEEGVSLEAKFVKALDRLECQIQHNEADIDTWLDIEKKRMFLGFVSYCEHDEGLLEFALSCREQSREKLSAIDIDNLRHWMASKPLKECFEEVAIAPPLTVGNDEQWAIGDRKKTLFESPSAP